MSYNGYDMIGDNGYGTWDVKRLDAEYRKVKAERDALRAENERLREALEFYAYKDGEKLARAVLGIEL